jgi:hypothetical protein
MLELRVATSLLRQRLERVDSQNVAEAGDCLAAIVNALPEGRDTPDVRGAALLLTQA